LEDRLTGHENLILDQLTDRTTDAKKRDLELRSTAAMRLGAGPSAAQVVTVWGTIAAPIIKV
jgi:hypothetical protein